MLHIVANESTQVKVGEIAVISVGESLLQMEQVMVKADRGAVSD